MKFLILFGSYLTDSSELNTDSDSLSVGYRALSPPSAVDTLRSEGLSVVGSFSPFRRRAGVICSSNLASGNGESSQSSFPSSIYSSLSSSASLFFWAVNAFYCFLSSIILALTASIRSSVSILSSSSSRRSNQAASAFFVLPWSIRNYREIIKSIGVVSFGFNFCSSSFIIFANLVKLKLSPGHSTLCYDPLSWNYLTIILEYSIT